MGRGTARDRLVWKGAFDWVHSAGPVTCTASGAGGLTVTDWVCVTALPRASVTRIWKENAVGLATAGAAKVGFVVLPLHKATVGQPGRSGSGSRRWCRSPARLAASILPKKNRTAQKPYDEDHHKLRHLVENAFLHLKRWRGIATRHAKNCASFLAATRIACLALWLKIS